MKNKVIGCSMLIISLLIFHSCQQDDFEDDDVPQTDIVDLDDISQFEKTINEELDFQRIPASSILIFREDETLYERYFGKANLEQNIPLAEDHLFLLASISKVITATALLQLHEEGLFSLDDKINDYLPFSVSVPNKRTPITFRMLLTHTSGIADGSALDDQYYYDEDSPVALDYFLENYLVAGGEFYEARENFYDFEPGTEHEYSNEGSALIAVLVEQISSMDFNTYCKSNIFDPLGMTHTFWRLDESIQSNSGLVQPYIYEDKQFEAIPHYTFTDYPNGGLRSTSRDMLRFFQAFVQDGISNDYQLLSSSAIKSMITPQIPSIDKEVGLHLFLMNSENNLWGHDGGEEGVATIIAFNPDTKIGAIILTNQGDAELDDLLVEAYKLGLKL